MARRSNAARRDASAARRREGIRSQPLSKALCRRFGGEMPSARATEPPLAPHPVDSTLPPDLRHSVLSTPREKCGFSPPAFSFALPALVAAHRTHESRNNMVAGACASERGESMEDVNPGLGARFLSETQ